MYKKIFLSLVLGLVINLLLNVRVFAFVASVDATYAPFAFEDEKGVYQGFEIDVIRALEKEIGEKAKIENMEYPGALVGITAGKIDMIVTADEGDVKKDRVFMTKPLMSCGTTIIANKSNKNLNTLDDLKNIKKGIGVIQGTVTAYTAQELAKEGKISEKQIKYFDNLTDMYESLNLNKIDAAINDSVVNTYYSKKTNKYSFKDVGEEFEETPGIMLISKKNPKLYKKVVTALEKFEKDGTLESIRKKWNFHL